MIRTLRQPGIKENLLILAKNSLKIKTKNQNLQLTGTRGINLLEEKFSLNNKQTYLCFKLKKSTDSETS